MSPISKHLLDFLIELIRVESSAIVPQNGMIRPDLSVFFNETAELCAPVVFDQNDSPPLKVLFDELCGEGAHKEHLQEPEFNVVVGSKVIHRVENRTFRRTPANQHGAGRVVAVVLDSVEQCCRREEFPTALVD